MSGLCYVCCLFAALNSGFCVRLLHGFYVRFLHCVEFPLTHAHRKLERYSPGKPAHCAHVGALAPRGPDVVQSQRKRGITHGDVDRDRVGARVDQMDRSQGCSCSLSTPKEPCTRRRAWIPVGWVQPGGSMGGSGGLAEREWGLAVASR